MRQIGSMDETAVRRLVFALVSVACVATLCFELVLGGGVAPHAHWHAGGDQNLATEQFVSVPGETRIGLELDLPEPAYVYAVRHDDTTGWIALTPSRTLRSDLPANPMQPGTHRLPGKDGENELWWSSGHSLGAVSFLLVVSDHPIESLDQSLARCQQMGNAAFPSREVLDPYAPDDGMENVPDPLAPLHPLFTEAKRFGRWETDYGLVPATGESGVFVGALRVQHALSGEEDLAERARDVERQIRDKFGELMNGGPGLGAPTTPPK